MFSRFSPTVRITMKYHRLERLKAVHPPLGVVWPQRQALYVCWALLVMLLSVFVATTCRADEPAGALQKFKFQVTGLFQPDREDDLRELLAKNLEIRVVDLDFEEAEIVVEFDPKKIWPGETFEKVEKQVELFDNLLKNGSRHTFGAKALRKTPLEKLVKVEILVLGLDCKACSFAAYDMVYRLPGVERATASFKAGRVTALIDPEKSNRAALEEALKKGGVDVR